MKAHMKSFVEERNEALFSLDKEKIQEYMKKYGVKIPDNEDVFWGGIYKSILCCTDSHEELKQKSRDWLDEKGWSYGI